MDGASRPGKPGWYWDPWELEFNLATRERWQQQIFPQEPCTYRLRRWDGQTWTPDTLHEYWMKGMTAVPHLMGPTTRVDPLTPSVARRNLKIWAACMVLGALALLVVELAG
jgi:hypothetical protein